MTSHSPNEIYINRIILHFSDSSVENIFIYLFKNVQFATNFSDFIGFSKFTGLEKVNLIFKMAASIVLSIVRILILGCPELAYLLSDFYRVCSRLHGYIRVVFHIHLLSMLIIWTESRENMF